MNALILATDNVSVAQNVAFGIIAAVMIFAALSVVTTKNVVHAALWLVVVLAGVAAQYILAAAEFVAVSQVLVYIGAVMVLFLFGIMLTRAQIGKEAGLNNPGWALGIPIALGLFGLLAWVIRRCVRRRRTARPWPHTDRALERPVPVDLPASVPRDLLRPAGGCHRGHRPGQEGLTAMLAVNFLLLGAALFCIGVYGVIARRNAVMVLMSIELILNAVSLNFVAFALMSGAVDGQVFALYVIAIAAAEVGVGLAMVLMIYRNRKSIALDELSEMKG